MTVVLKINTMLSNLTIVIPTKNRHHYLERIIDYYENSGLQIVIADATLTPYVKRIPGNIQYCHYPNIPYCTKLKQIFEKIETPFSLLCADDDFIIPQGMHSCVEFLEANPTYNSSQGHYTFFYHSKDKLFYTPAYLSAIGSDFNEETARERIEKFSTVSIQFYYCIHKTETLKDVFMYASNKFTNLNLVELFMGMSTLIKGKHKVLPVFYSVRELLYGSAGKSHGLMALASLPQYKDQYNAFFSETVRLLSKYDNMKESEASLFLSHIIQSRIDSGNRKRFSFNNFVTRLAKKVIPFYWRKTLRHYIELLHEKKREKVNYDLASRVKGFPFVKDGNQELQRIELFIKKYNIHQ